MKRLLSLLVVIAMMVSLMPNVFAAKEEVDFDELTGRLVVLEDIAEINVVLAEGSDGMIYQWTPDANYNLSLSYTAPEGTEIAVTVTQGEASAAAADGAVSMDVWAEQVVEIEVSEAAALAAEFTISGEAWAVPGSDEWNGIFLGQMENAVTAAGTTFSGNTTWYQGYFSGTVMTITGTGAYNVIYNGETIAAVDGVVSTAVASANPRMPVVFAIDAVGEYTISFAYPAGSQANPAQLVIGENTVEFAEGAGEYFYNWTAEEEGKLVITMPEGNWQYTLSNMTTGVYGEIQWSDSDPVANPAVLDVAAGDVIELKVLTYDPANPWATPAGSITFTADFELPEPPAPALTITAQPESLTRLPGEAASFTVVAEGEGLTYKWQYKNAGEETWRNTSLTGYNTATLSVSNAVVGSTHNGRQYKCIITDANGNSVETEPATLTVIYMISDAKSQGVQIGETAVFTVKHSDPGATYRWQYKGNTSASTWANTSATGNKTDTLQVVAKATNNGYMYRCNITLSDGTVLTSKEVYLNVTEDPAVITANPVDASAVCGDYATFSIAAEGDGLVYQWQFYNPAVGVWTNTKGSGYSTNTLKVKTNNFNSGYMYRCVVKTYNGVSGGVTLWNRTYTDAATLTVLPAADILEELPETVTVKVGEQAVFHIGADGEALTYQWQWAKFKGNWKNTTMSGATTDTLTTNAVTAEMNGRYYRVIITNAYGGKYESAAVQLFVEE